MRQKDDDVIKEVLTRNRARVLEVFRSVQGEGKYAGVQQVFVRFCGCNLRCAWCDTREMMDAAGSECPQMTIEDLWKRVDPLLLGCHSVSITGGEPLLQAGFLKEFLPILRASRVPVYLETNGTLPDELSEVVEDVDIISMDVKLPSSTRCEPFWDEHVMFLRAAWGKEIFVKSVISMSTVKEDIVRAVDMISRGDASTPFFLQPNHFDLQKGVMGKCMEFQDYCMNYLSDVRIMPQMHKFMDLK